MTGNTINFHTYGTIDLSCSQAGYYYIWKEKPNIFPSQHIKNICYVNTDRQSNPYVQLCVVLFQDTDNFTSLQ